jgi:anti-anti-sigma regulatory factor
VVLYRFTAWLIFYNASYFRRRVLAVAAADPGASWLVIDGGPIAHLDSTGADTLVALADVLSRRGIKIAIGGVLPQVRRMLERSGALERLGTDAVFPSLRAAVEACEPSAGRAPASRNGSLSSVRGEQT